ncbi:hypothetical protein CSA17_00030, partial [bacterium DOLJORAL78_65_58]
MIRLWPPVAALLVIFLTRNALVGLLCGAAAGALLLAGGHPLTAAQDLVTRDLLPHFRSSWKMGAIAFTLLLGGFAGMLEAGGGFTRLVRGRAAESATRLEGAAAGLGLLCFFDGLANSMVVGRVTRDLADRHYCWLTLVMLFVAIRLRFHPGPMAGFVAEASLRRPLSGYSSSGSSFSGYPSSGYPPAGTAPAASPNPPADGPVRAALLPLAVLMASFFVFFLALGTEGPLWPLTREKVVAAFGSDAGPLVLILAALTASLAALVVFPRRRQVAVTAFARGTRAMLAPILILVAAWMLGSVIGLLDTATWLSSLATGGLATGGGSLALMPSLVFLTGAVISFSTGTSWGTMGILFPLTVPAAAQLGAEPGFLTIIVGAVFSGAVFGDHCSPFSDTTIVSSISCGVTPHDHVRTQMP